VDNIDDTLACGYDRIDIRNLDEPDDVPIVSTSYHNRFCHNRTVVVSLLGVVVAEVVEVEVVDAMPIPVVVVEVDTLVDDPMVLASNMEYIEERRSILVLVVV
jgi:hypothetical protein